MANEIFGTGLLPSPIDTRDIPLSAVAPSIVRIPDKVLPPFDLTILNQGQDPACVGFACAAYEEYLKARQKMSKVFNGKWIYDECKKIDGIPNQAGTYFRTGMKVLQKTGALPLSGGIPSDFKLGSYAQIDNITEEELKKDIFLYGAVIAGFKGSNDGWKGEIVRAPLAGEATWGHAVLLTGYDDLIIGQNSWGEAKHNKGQFKVAKGYLPFEAWVAITDLPVVERGTIGWIAKQYVIGGLTTTYLKLRAGASLSAEVIKILPPNTKVEQISAGEFNADGYVWINVAVA